MPNSNTNPLDKAINLRQLQMAYEELQGVATQSDNGLMSKEDKSTLDNIAAGYVSAAFVGETLVFTNGGEFVDEILVLG